MPKRPLRRPDAASVENALVDPLLDSMLDSLVLMTINEAMIKIRGAAKNQLLMQPLSTLFPHRTQAVQVLRELFVTRESSYAHYDEENRLNHISIFKAIFNDADEMTCVFVVTSPQTGEVKERYNNLPLDFAGGGIDTDSAAAEVSGGAADADSAEAEVSGGDADAGSDSAEVSEPVENKSEVQENKDTKKQKKRFGFFKKDKGN